MKLNCPNGLTIRQMKEFLKDLPETDSKGVEHEIWLDQGKTTKFEFWTEEKLKSWYDAQG